jgi:hypothetical protein
VIVVAVVVVVLIALALVPIPHSFSGSLSSTLITPARQSLTFPDDSSVSFSWSTTNGGTVVFDLVNSAGTTVYSETASSGSYSFTADGNAYLFESAAFTTETVQFSGTYSIPLI